jgi:tellurite resistance protein TehA-like permease
MINIKVVILLTIGFLLAVSTYALVKASDLAHPEVDQPFKLRFLCLCALNLMVLLSLLLALFLQGTYSYILLIFANCLVSVFAMSATELIVRPLETHPTYTFRNDGNL